jgi:predicted nucleic acid-binding protein
MDAKAFVDTNILLRVLLTEMNLHAKCDALLKRTLRENIELWISGQVIREFIVQATHPRTLKEPLTIEQVVHQLNTIQPSFHIADETPAVREQLLKLLLEYPTRGKQVHDANIVATMLVYGIDTLLTLNVDDFRRFEDKITLTTLEGTE